MMQSPKVYRVDDLTIDTGTRQVFRGKQEIQLPKLSFDLLVALIAAAPNTLSIDELIEQVWSGAIVSSSTVSKRVELLRQALGEDSNDPRYVALVRSHGYRLLPRPVQDPQAKKSKHTRLVTVAAIVVLIIAVASWYLQRPPATPPEKSIVVLPFKNLTEGDDNEYLSDGLTVELTNRLTTIPDLKVAAVTSAFAFKGRDVNIREIAEQLRVAHVLTGSVRRSGDRLRISAQLIDTGDGYQRWSRRWEHAPEDIFNVQDQITASIVDALQLELARQPDRAKRVDPEAYDVYLQGKSELLSNAEPDVDNVSQERLARAMAFTTHALAVEPDFAAAWSQLAAIQLNQAQWMDGSERDEMYARAEAAAKRALASDANQALALTVLGSIYGHLYWDVEEAANWYRRALSAAPGRAGTLNAIAVLYDRLGQPEIAHEYFVAAYELDQLSATKAANLALSYRHIGDKEAATSQLERAKLIAPDAVRVRVFDALFAYLDGDFDRAAALSEGLNPVLRICALYGAERFADSVVELEKLLSDERLGAMAIATTYACQNDSDRAFEWLHRALDDRDSALQSVRGRVLLSGLHGDPRWDEFLEKVGVSDQHLSKVIAALGN